MAQAAHVLATADPQETEEDEAIRRRSPLPDAIVSAGGCVWRWDRVDARLTLQGDVAALGLPPEAAEDALDNLLAALRPADRLALDAALARRPPGSPIAARLHLEDGRASLWRGVWSPDGLAAEGVALPEPAIEDVERGRDALTGLLDRATFMTRIAERLARGQGVRVVTADILRFRRLNAALGPDLADLVLAALGGRLNAAYDRDVHGDLKGGGCPARIGEDEFAVLLELGEADAFVPLRAVLERPLRVAGCDVHPTFSLGAGEAAPGEAVTVSEVMRRAAAAVISMRDGDLEDEGEAPHDLSRLTLENDLRGALGRGELEPYFQPIVRLADNRLAGFEALVRWRHPKRGLIPPDDFLPLLSEARLMAALGRHMTRTCAERLAEWRTVFPGAQDLFVTVNLTVGELDRPGLVDDVAAILEETGLPPGKLKLELTEGEVMRDPDAAVKVLTRLRAAGAGLAIDDFGMGFSSLSYLTRLPVDTLKVDRYFVRTMGVSESSAKVMRSIVALGRDLGLTIVGEGVEDADTAARLREIGCTFGQGYGYARPLGLDDAEEYLRNALVHGAQIREGAPAR